MTTPTPARKPRCRVLGLHTGNRCANESLTPGVGVCLKHLREFAQEWADLVRNALDQFPALAQLVQEDDPA